MATSRIEVAPEETLLRRGSPSWDFQATARNRQKVTHGRCPEMSTAFVEGASSG
jgi:hypothetical protein